MILSTTCAIPWVSPAIKENTIMINRILKTTIYSASIAGIVLGLMLTCIMTPIILKAETFEMPGQAAPAMMEILKRDGLSLLGTITLALAYAFFLSLAATFLAKELSVLKKGLLIGMGGFLLFYGIPNLGQPPILPGMESCSPVTLRQFWYVEALFFAVLAAGTYFLMTRLFKIRWLSVIVALSILLIPFISGIPNSLEGNKVPAELLFQFRVASFGVNLAFWLILALSVSYFSDRFSKKSF